MTGSSVCQAATNAATAEAAGLRYVSDAQPGIARRKSDRGFAYIAPDGTPATAAQRERARSLMIPPAWREVWICPSPRGHIQATGRDARGRKQYIYHPEWRTARDTAKYERLQDFASRLPALRARVQRDLKRPADTRRRVLAAAVALLDKSLLRVGNDEYAATNGSYGLTTLRCDHAEVTGNHVRFLFNGKSGKEQAVDVMDRRVANVVRRCQELPGQYLLQYRGNGDEVGHVTSDDVNAYLREATGRDVTAKTFRTWGASVQMAEELAALGPAHTTASAKRNVAAATRAVAKRLGNTIAVARQCYIHPALGEAYHDGTFPHRDRSRYREAPGTGLQPGERFLLRILANHAADDEGRLKTTPMHLRIDEQRDTSLTALARGTHRLADDAVSWAQEHGYGTAVRWLRGEPLGHPAHPAFVDAAGGYWMASITLDALAALGFRSFGRAADAMLGLGLASSAPTIAAGIAEYAGLEQRSWHAGLLHASIALSATAMYAASLALRLTGRRHAAFLVSAAASGVAIAAAQRGGKLVFEHGAGVKPRSEPVPGPVTVGAR